jgi:hypothetical protein
MYIARRLVLEASFKGLKIAIIGLIQGKLRKPRARHYNQWRKLTVATLSN